MKLSGKIALFILGTTLLSVGSCKPALSPKESMLAKLQNISDSEKIMFGHQDTYLSGHGWIKRPGDTTWRSDVKDITGDFPAVFGCDLGDIELDALKNLDSIPFDLMKEAIIYHYNRGGVVTVSWHSKNPITGGSTWDVSDSLCIKSILPGNSHHEKYIVWLDKVGEFLRSVNELNGEVIPVIFRPYHEHTGSWFWWGNHDSQKEDFIQLWQMTYNHLTQNWGLDQLIWAYSPNLGVDEAGYMERYPGDEYVDMFGFDIYQFNGSDGNDSYVTSVKNDLKFLTKLGIEHNKPIAFTETGLESIPYPEWWSTILLNSIEEFPICYVLVWRNSYDMPDHHFGPYSGHTSENDFISLYKSPKTLFLKELSLETNN